MTTTALPSLATEPVDVEQLPVDPEALDASRPVDLDECSSCVGQGSVATWDDGWETCPFCGGTGMRGAHLGSVSPMMRRVATAGASDDCWIWPGARSGDGLYGNTALDGGTRIAHRAMYEALVGPIPEGLELDHLCRVTLCVNPAHLEPVTHDENKRCRYADYDHCVNGHPYDEENTYVRPNGNRDCRTCIRERVRAYHARKAAS